MSSALDECNCSTGLQLVVPIVTGILMLVVLVGMLLFCSSRRIGASLFAETVFAERSAKKAIREAGVCVFGGV